MRHHMKVAHCLAAVLCALALISSGRAAEPAASFPSRPIKIFVGFPPGGSTDGPMRVLAAQASKLLKQPIIVENKTGAGGTMPAVALQSSSNDGYTLGVTSLGIFRLPYTTEIKWDPVKDLTYVIGLTGYTFGIVVPSSSPIRTWQDFLAAAKAKPGQLTYGTAGIATTQHLTMEQISRATGTELNHVPYKGTGNTVQALLGNEVDAVADTSAWAQFVRDGKMRVLVTWGPKRAASFPDTPTLHEVGIPITQTSQWGLIAPKDTNPVIVAKLHDAFKQAMEAPEFKQALAQYDMEPEYRNSKDFQQFAIDTMKKERTILDEPGLSRK